MQRKFNLLNVTEVLQKMTVPFCNHLWFMVDSTCMQVDLR